MLLALWTGACVLLAVVNLNDHKLTSSTDVQGLKEINPFENGTMSFRKEDSAEVRSLTSYGICQTDVNTENVVAGTQIRTVSRSGVRKMKKLLAKRWKMDSYIFVVEQEIAPSV